MCKKCKCGICIVFAAVAALIAWMLYERAMSSKEISHDGSTLVKDMKAVCSNTKAVCSDAGKLSRDVADEAQAMKDELVKEVKDVKNAVCGCDNKKNGSM